MTTQQQKNQEMAVGQVEMALRQDGRARMAGNTQAFLRNHAPFNKMQPDALQYFAEKAQIVFYAAGSEIVGPDSGKVRYFYLIESGKVQARQAGEVTVTEYSILSLGAGKASRSEPSRQGAHRPMIIWRWKIPFATSCPPMTFSR